jgi:hypothetical protein
MRSDLTDITVMIDRSGSMASMKKDAEGGVNSFVDEQKKQAGEALFTLVQFDTEYEFVHKAIPIKDVGGFTLNPRGGTALLDAVGRSISETGQRLAAMPEDQRPALVVFVILTDGQENSSKEFSQPQIKEMIKTQSESYKWQFVFLGANQDSFASAGGIGIVGNMAANYTSANTAFTATSSNVSRSRCMVKNGLMPDMTYSAEQRKQMTESH